MQPAGQKAGGPAPVRTSASAAPAAKRPPSGIRYEQYNLLLALCVSPFLSGCLTSVLIPVLPKHLEQMHTPVWLRGFIFGVYPYTVALVSLFVPQMTERFGRKPLLVLALAAEGCLVIMFGTIHLRGRHGDYATPWLLLFLRFLTGCAEAVQNTILSLFATDAFYPQGNLGQVLGWVELSAGVGFIVGPAIGAPLFVAGGFHLPFLVLGLAFLSLLPLLPFALRHVPPFDPHAIIGVKHPFRAFLTYDVVNAAVGTFSMGCAFGAIQPTLADHLERRLGIHGVLSLGAICTIPALVYGIACPLAGVLADRGSNRMLMRNGYALLAVAFFMMGPIPLVHPILPWLWESGSPAAWIWAVGAMALFGVGGACGFVPTMPAMQRGAAHLGSAAVETVTSVYWTAYFLGEGSGPLLGTMLVGYLGPGWGYSFIALALVAFVTLSTRYEKGAPLESSLGKGGYDDDEEKSKDDVALGSMGPGGGVAGEEEERETAGLLAGAAGRGSSGGGGALSPSSAAHSTSGGALNLGAVHQRQRSMETLLPVTCSAALPLPPPPPQQQQHQQHQPVSPWSLQHPAAAPAAAAAAAPPPAVVVAAPAAAAHAQVPAPPPPRPPLPPPQKLPPPPQGLPAQQWHASQLPPLLSV